MKSKNNIIRNPIPFLPKQLRSISDEGFGEVQTPLIGESTKNINIGEYVSTFKIIITSLIFFKVFFRSAKAGEIGERFNSYICKRENQIEFEVKTYRGLGHCFY